MRVEEIDLAKLKGLKALISKGSFDLNGEAIVKAASLIVWLDQFETRMQDSLESITDNQPLKAKEVKEKVKKL